MGPLLVQAIGPPLAALCFALILIQLLRQAAPGLGLVDQPGGRKTHRHPTPVVGGLGMGFALLLALPFLLHGLDGAVGAGWLGSARPWLPLGIAALLLVLAGLVDDAHGLSSGPKFAIQALAAVLAIAWGGIELASLGQWPSGEAMGLGPLILPLTLLALVGFVNAFNMIDGVVGSPAAPRWSCWDCWPPWRASPGTGMMP